MREGAATSERLVGTSTADEVRVISIARSIALGWPSPQDHQANMMPTGSSNAELHRAVRKLRACGTEWPEAWRVHNEYRAHREQHGDWPEYVFAPRQAARNLVMSGARIDSQTSTAKLAAIALVGTMAAWRPTQGIYRFATNLLDELWDTPVTGDLPADLLHRLPEWCVYIELGRGSSVGVVHGAWARIGFDAERREEELDLLIDVDVVVPPVIRLPLIGTLEESLDVTRRDVRARARGEAVRLIAAEMQLAEMRKLVEPVLSVILYLCSANAEIESNGRAHLRRRPVPRRLRNGEVRWPAAQEPTVWATGTRLGAALQRAHVRANDEQSGEAVPFIAPHIRRAHWHTYWLGAIDSPERHRELRWLPPIAVNLDEAPSVATVRPVPEPTSRR